MSEKFLQNYQPTRTPMSLAASTLRNTQVIAVGLVGVQFVLLDNNEKSLPVKHVH